MIVCRFEDTIEIVTQNDHARLARQIAALWRADGVPAHERRSDLLLAVGEHDNGWREADAAPRLDPASGAPVDFRTFPADERRLLWERGVARLADRPFAAALVAQHALELHRGRPGPDWTDFLERLEARRVDLAAAAGAPIRAVEAVYPFLAVCDTVSLAACGAFPEAEVAGRRIAAGRDAVALEPFPLAGATTFQIPFRALAKPAKNAVELAAGLAEARWRRRPVRLQAAPA